VSGRVPVSTYRLQVTAAQDLHMCADLLPYLHDLGADWVYLSPVLAAEPGSDHGYDVVAHDHVDPSRGGAEGLAALSAAARRLGMGVLVDVVPNHVGVATPRHNAWWWELLATGRDGARASTFDVDWDAGEGRVRIPVLGDDALDPASGAVEVDTAAGVVSYHEHTFPLAEGTTTLEEQHYELVHWTRADHELNYRRFFAVNSLAAVRVEDSQVLADTHHEIGRWFREGLVDGLRVDHPDGLLDPRGYLDDLAGLTDGAYVLVEKILEPGEALPTSWATAGTTGYDALALVDRVLVDPAGQAPLDALETRLRGGEVVWDDLVHERKRAVADGILGSEVRRIVRDLGRPDGDPEAVDAVAELLACFPVYRSYLRPGDDTGVVHLEQALTHARARRPDLLTALDEVHALLEDPEQPAARRFQQTSGMVMAKGVEDCSFYRWSRLTSLNEVGGDPAHFALDVTRFHDAMGDRQEHWPHAMTTLSTHDTKRGEDVRARIHVLAEDPAAWEAALEELLALAPLPDAGFGSLLWQAVLGVWGSDPDDVLGERLHGYAMKAMREAGDRTTWTAVDDAYENAVHAAVDAAFDWADVRAVLDRLLGWTRAAGEANALSAKLLALTMPGVPDVYQGSELAEQSLVDPDNRRPVDFDRLRRELTDLTHPKLRVTATALRLRRERPDLFSSYAAVPVTGEAADHAVAFDRGGALTVATRLPLGLARRGGWGGTALALPEGRWVDQLTGQEATGRLADLLATFPVALLVREDR